MKVDIKEDTKYKAKKIVKFCVLFPEQEATQDNFTDLTGNFPTEFVFISWPDLLQSWRQENTDQRKVKYCFFIFLLCVYPLSEGSTIFEGYKGTIFFF